MQTPFMNSLYLSNITFQEYQNEVIYTKIKMENQSMSAYFAEKQSLKCLRVIESSKRLTRLLDDGKIEIKNGKIVFCEMFGKRMDKSISSDDLMKDQFGYNVKVANRFDVLEEEPISMVTFLEPRKKKLRFRFLQKDLVQVRRIKRRRSRLLKKQLKRIHFDAFVPPVRSIVLLFKLRSMIRQLVEQRTRSFTGGKFNLRKFPTIDPDERYFDEIGKKYGYLNLEAQMDEREMDAQGSSTAPIVENFGNTLNESARVRSVGEPALSKGGNLFRSMASAESSPDYGMLTNRFFPHETYIWKASDLVGAELVKLTLPLDFIVEHIDSANSTMFNNYSYWDGDIEVKLMVNSNKFQVGQLQMSWYYGQDYETNFDRRNNVFTASQQAHCLVSASTSNEGSMYIPFKYYKPKMGTKQRVDDPGRLNMGKLTVRVLNRLDCPSTVYKQCHFTVSFRFVNSSFGGMVARDLGKLEANMMEATVGLAAVNLATNLLVSRQSDNNRDNPPDVGSALHVVPWSAHSWSVGDKLVEPTNPLRLVATGQVPHPPEVQNGNEMNINFIAGIFSLLKQIQWSTDTLSGQQLFELPGGPQYSYVDLYSQTFDGTTCYAYPAVSVLSSLFAYWRGSIELRMDVIATPFHTGRLLIAYVPRVLVKPTLEQLKSCPHAIYDLQGENRQFVFTIPYIADRPWWPSRSFTRKVLPPSYIYCYVLNELVPMDNVSKTIDINLYVRGGSDFEVSIPVSPRIGLSTYNCHVKVPQNATAVSIPGYTPMYTGEWRYLYNGTKKILRYGEVTDHITQFKHLKSGKVYEQDIAKNNNKTIGGENKKTSWYIVGVPIDVSNGFCPYATYFNDKTRALAYAKSNPVNNDLIDDFVSNSDYFLGPNGDPWDGVIYFKESETRLDPSVIVHSPPRESYVHVTRNDPLRDINKSDVQLGFNKPFFVGTFYINEYDKKDIRVHSISGYNSWYGIWLPHTYTLSNDLQQESIIKLDVYYEGNGTGVAPRGKQYLNGELVDTSSDHVPQAGVYGIPLEGRTDNQLLGRFLGVASDYSVDNLVILNKLEAQMDERKTTQTSSINMLSEVSSTGYGFQTFGENFNDLKNYCRRYQLYHSYKGPDGPSQGILIGLPILPQGLPHGTGYIDSSTRFNMNREGPIPLIASAYRFYRGGIRFKLVYLSATPVMLRVEIRPDERLSNIQPFNGVDHQGVFNDGYAYIIQHSKLNSIIEFEVPFYQCGMLGMLQYPAIAEDLESYHFSLGNMYIGIFGKVDKPLAFDLYYALADDCSFSVFQGFPMVMPAPDFGIAEAQMGLFTDIKDSVAAFKATSERLENISNKIDIIVPEVNQAEIVENESLEAKNSLFHWITHNVPEALKQAFVNGMSQIVHCFINPTIGTISWAFSSFLGCVGILCSGFVSKFSEYFGQFVNWISKFSWRSNQTKQETDVKPEVIPEGDGMPLEVKAGLIGTIVASISATLGCVGKLPKTMPDFFKGCWNNLGKFGYTANQLCVFFKNNLLWILDIYRWIVRKAFPNRALSLELGTDVELKTLVDEILVLLDESNARKIEIHPKWNLRVYLAATRASALLSQMAIGENIPRTPVLSGLLQKIISKRDELVKYQLSPPIRFEPYVVAFTGESNLGKSHLCQEIGKECLREVNYKSFEELIYTRTPGNPYWNQLRNQPICLFDDFVAIEGESGLQQVGELFCLKSKAVFNPPQAEIKDKFIRYNPLMVLLASNNPFPKLPGVACPTAFFRRRDQLIKVSRNEAFYRRHGVALNESPRAFPKGAIKNYEHLNFSFANDSADERTGYSARYTYIELCEKLRKLFKDNYVKELEQYERALKEINEFYPDDEDFGLSIGENITRNNERIDSVNAYRFESFDDLKTLIASMIERVKDANDKSIPIILSGLKQLKTREPQLVSRLISSNSVIRAKYNASILTLEAQGDEIRLEPYVCIHGRFKRDMVFHRSEEIKDGIVPQGHFFDIMDEPSQRIPEGVCDGNPEDCVWNDTERLRKDMNNWMDYSPGIDRRMSFRTANRMALPMFFIRTLGGAETLSKRLYGSTDLTKEIESWSQWSKRMLKSIGSGLWACIRWASKIIMVAASIFAVVGVAKQMWAPEESAVRYEQKLLDKNIHYNVAKQKAEGTYQGSPSIYASAKQGAFGAFDATAEYSCELASNAHYTQQKEYQNDLLSRVLSLNAGEGQMAASGDPKTHGKSTPQQVKAVALKMVGNMAKEKETAIIRMIKRNTIFIVAQYNTTEICGRMIGLCDHYALAVDHYDDKLRILPDNSNVYLLGHGFKLLIKYSDLEYHKINNSSLGYYKLPDQVNPFKNILKHFARRKDHEHVGPLSRLVEVCSDLDTVFVSEEYATRVSAVIVEASNGYDEFVIPDGYKYARGGRGVCGSVLLSDHLEHPIYGLHVAGDIGGRYGMSEAIYYEMFEPLLQRSLIRDVIEPNMAEYTIGYMKPQSHAQIVGIVDRNLAHRETGVSKVIPTECSGEIFPLYCAPPILSQRDERINDKPFSPMQEGINKHGLVTDNFPMEYLESAYQDLRNVILAKVRPVRGVVGKLTKAIAVVGDPYTPGFEKLDFNTSEGFPFVSLRQGQQKSKKWLLDLTQDSMGNYELNGIDQIVKDTMFIKKQQRLRRELPFTVFTDCLKDRKLPISKVLIPGKVRIFSISPLDFTIQCRQYFMDFSVSYQNARFDAEHAIGIDVNSYEWSILVSNLMNMGSKIVTADYSNFGPTLNALCCKKALQIIRDWYKFHGDHDEDNDLIREMMGYEMIYSTHLCFSTVYRTMCGLPSGGPLTVILNSLVNCLYLRVAWQMIFSELNYDEHAFENVNYTLQSMHKHAVWYVYGDDVIMSVSDESARFYNCETIAKCLSKFRIDIKNATKKQEVVKYQSLFDKDTSFLKNNIIAHPNRPVVFLAALEIASVEDTLNWTFKEWIHKLREISLEASDQAIRNAFGHGPEYYEYVRSKVFNYWQRKGEFLNTPSWRELDRKNFA